MKRHNRFAKSSRSASAKLLGLIAATDGAHAELHGFEVEMDGSVIAPAFAGKPDELLRLQACIKFASCWQATVERVA